MQDRETGAAEDDAGHELAENDRQVPGPRHRDQGPEECDERDQSEGGEAHRALRAMDPSMRPHAMAQR